MSNPLATKNTNNLVQLNEEKRIEPLFGPGEDGEEHFRGLVVNGRNIELTLDMPKEEKALLTTALKDLTGHSNIDSAVGFLLNTAETLCIGGSASDLKYLISFLHEMKPADAIEAKLLAQFLLLEATAAKLLHNAKHADVILHGEFNYKHSMKAMNLSQQVIQSLMKYKAKGAQQINIVHMNGDSKAVFTGGGCNTKNK